MLLAPAPFMIQIHRHVETTDKVAQLQYMYVWYMALWNLFPRHLNRKVNLARRKAGANSPDSWMGGRGRGAYKFANGLAEINDLPFPNEPPLKKDSFKHHLLWSTGRLAGAGGFAMVDMDWANVSPHLLRMNSFGEGNIVSYSWTITGIIFALNVTQIRALYWRSSISALRGKG